jgi:hypothetical protein
MLSSLVNCQITVLCKRFATQSATAWFFTCMNSQVYVQLPEVLLRCAQLNNLVFLTAGILCLIMLSTFALLIPIFDNTYFFSMNYFNVDCQTALLCKRFVTQCATEWLFTCMNSHMYVKRTFLAKSFIALLTAEQLCFFDSTHILFSCNVSFCIDSFMPIPEKKTFLKGQANKHLMFSEFSLQVFKRQADKFLNYYYNQ